MSRTKQANHYGNRPDVIDFNTKYKLNFNLGSAVKYIARAGKKEGEPIEKDLNKAIDCIKRELERMQTTQILGRDELIKQARERYKECDKVVCLVTGKTSSITSLLKDYFYHAEYKNGDEHLTIYTGETIFLYDNGKWATHV